MKIVLRPPQREDAASVAEVAGRFGQAYGADHESASDIETWFDDPGLDLEHDARVAVTDDGIVGYADISDAAHEGKLLWVDLRVDPAHSDVEPTLLGFVEQRAPVLARPGARIKIWAPENAESLRGLLESRGYKFDHYSIRMVAALDADPPELVWPEGVTVRTFCRDEDVEAVYEAHQETFSDQPDFFRDPYEEWQHWSFRKPFDPELWFLAIDDSEIAGISLCRSEFSGDPDLGWVSILGVRRPWRRRGLGLALLHHSFRELRARGKSRVGLGVAADNPTGAVRLYERAGMSPVRKHLWYERPV
ncbi:MAG TPA: GNAT family N-acetyltransferase [Gaiellaceae bacterium]